MVVVSVAATIKGFEMPDNDEKTVVTASANQVDESLSTGTELSRVGSDDQRRELEELQSQLRDLRSAARRPSITKPRPSSGAARSMRDEVEYQIRLQPLKAVAVAAVVGFVYGVAR